MAKPGESIGAASAALALHPQTLRKYERAGLLRPARSAGSRSYSSDDLDRLALIKHLSDARRLNIAGVALALDLLDALDALLADLDGLDAPRAQSVARERVLAIVTSVRR